eukprot:sb/3463901/
MSLTRLSNNNLLQINNSVFFCYKSKPSQNETSTVLSGIYYCLSLLVNGSGDSFSQGAQVEAVQPEAGNSSGTVVEHTAPIDPKPVLPMTHSLAEGGAPPPTHAAVMVRAPPLDLEYSPEGPELDLPRSNLRKTMYEMRIFTILSICLLLLTQSESFTQRRRTTTSTTTRTSSSGSHSIRSHSSRYRSDRRSDDNSSIRYNNNNNNNNQNSNNYSSNTGTSKASRGTGMSGEVVIVLVVAGLLGLIGTCISVCCCVCSNCKRKKPSALPEDVVEEGLVKEEEGQLVNGEGLAEEEQGLIGDGSVEDKKSEEATQNYSEEHVVTHGVTNEEAADLSNYDDPKTPLNSPNDVPPADFQSTTAPDLQSPPATDHYQEQYVIPDDVAMATTNDAITGNHGNSNHDGSALIPGNGTLPSDTPNVHPTPWIWFSVVVVIVMVERTNQNSLFRSRDWLSDSLGTDRPIRTRYLGRTRLFEDVLIKEMLELLIRKVDAKLLKSISMFEVLETKDIKKPDREVMF